MPEKTDSSAVTLYRASFVRKRTGLIEDEYIPGRVIGDGAFGVVSYRINKINGTKPEIKTI